jgi:predicted alpha/beta hydrolase family esterase
MKKVFIIHGFEGSPNGGWRPWLMGELEKIDIYACALAMPNPYSPICNEWTNEIARNIDNNKNDEIYLIGHSLGAPAILRYLEQSQVNNIRGVILVSGPSENNNNKKLDSFLNKDFDFHTIKLKAKNFCIIHGDNDLSVPISNAQFLAEKLQGNLIIIPNGGHLNGASGCFVLPQLLNALQEMFSKD